MNQGRVSEVIGKDNARALDEFMTKSGIPLMVLITTHEAALAQAQGARVDFVTLAEVLRHLADQVEALGASQPMVLH